MDNSILALVISLGVIALICFWLAYKYKEKIGFGFGLFFLIFALMSMHHGSLGHPAKCDVGYYKMLAGVYDNKEFHFLARDVNKENKMRLCQVPFKNVHTMQWQDVYVWLIDGEYGQELYLTSPPAEVDTD